MLTAAVDMLTVAAETLGLIAGICGLIALGAFVYAYFRASRGQATTTLQADTIAALEAANNEKADRIQLLESRLDDLTEQVTVLRELVTQTAKVDVLRTETAKGFEDVLAELRARR